MFNYCIWFSLWPQFLTCFLSWQVYLINVTYSDNTSHIIYRRYSKFFDLQVIIHHSQAPYCAGGVSIEILYLFSSNAFCTCEPAQLFVQINLQALWLFPAVVSVFPPLTPLWITVWVSNWSGSRGDMACICQLYGVAPICHISLALCGVSISLLFLFSDPFSLISSLPYLLHVKELTGLFMLQAGKLKRKINVMYWALWQFLNVTPTWRTLFCSCWRQVLWMEQSVALKELYCTSSIKNSVRFESLCDKDGPSACKLIPYVHWTKGSPVNMFGLHWETYRGQK